MFDIPRMKGWDFYHSLATTLTELLTRGFDCTIYRVTVNIVPHQVCVSRLKRQIGQIGSQS